MNQRVIVLKRMSLGVVPELPDEILEEILVRLQINTLVSLTAVCKSWNSLIKSSSFIRAHLNRNKHNQILLVEAGGSDEIDEYPLFHLIQDRPPFDVYSNYKHITNPFVASKKLHATLRKNNEVRVIGSCNALVCVVHDETAALVWNPCIRKFVTLPGLTEINKNDQISYGFGYDPSTNDYKVVRIVEYEAAQKTTCDIWSLAQPSWKGLSARPPVDKFNPCRYHTVFFRGAVHWLHSKYRPIDCRTIYFIVSFDISSESFGEMIMTPEDMKGYMTMTKYKNSLMIIESGDIWRSTRQYHLWEMREYGVVESWTKLITVELPAPRIWALGFINNGEVVIRYKGEDSKRWPLWRYLEWILLNPNNGNISNFRTMGGDFNYRFVEPFLESLVLLDHPSAISS